MVQGELRELAFRQVSHGEVNIFDGDYTHGDDVVVGELKSLHCSKETVVFIVAFRPGPDARGDDPKCYGEVEFLVTRTKGRLVGRITRQAPERFCSAGGAERDWKVLDGLGSGPGSGHRPSANFFCLAHSSSRAANFTVTAYLKTGLLGGWSEIILRTPKKALYLAQL